MNVKPKFVLLTMPALLFAACSSAPTFTDAPQADAASLEGPVVPTQGPEDGNCSVVIVQVDGLHSDFTASHQGLNWHASGSAKPLLLAASKHHLTLNISYAEAAGGGPRGPSPQGSGDQGPVGGIGEYKATSIAEIFPSLEAGRVYRITAAYENEAIVVILWDETDGALVRTRVADWSFNAPRTHTLGTGPNDHLM
jgi:hypothetical protein